MKILKYLGYIISFVFVFFFFSCSFEMPNLESPHRHDYYEDFDMESHYKICRDDDCRNKIDIVPHTFGEWKVDKEATHYEVGSQVRTCTGCIYSEREEIAKTPHTLIHHEKIEPTCTEYGQEEYYECSECEKLYKTENALEEDIIEDVSSLRIRKTKHKNVSKYEFVRIPSTESVGYIDFYCECNVRIMDFMVPGFDEYSGNDVAYSWVESGEKCLETRKKSLCIKEEYIRNCVKEELEKYPDYYYADLSIIDSLIEKMDENKEFEKSYKTFYYDTIMHNFVCEIIEKSTLEDNGKYTVYCEECKEQILNDEGEVYTILPKGIEGCFKIVDKLDATCVDDGYAKYSYDRERLFYHMQREYSTYPYVGRFRWQDTVVKNCDFPIYEVEEKAVGHTHEANLVEPTLTTEGLFEIKCNKCDDRLTNTENKSINIPILSNTNFFDFSTTTTCTQDGIDTYRYNQSVLKQELIDKLGLDEQTINRYLSTKLEDINISTLSVGHTYKDHIVEILAYPTLNEEGKLGFKCDKCSYYREVSEGINYLVVPAVCNEDYFAFTNIDATCSSKGTIRAYINKTWYETHVPSEWEEYYRYIENDEITPKFRDYIVEVDSVNHSITFNADYENFILTIKCRYEDCNHNQTVIELPSDWTDELYKRKEVIGDCKTEGYIQYSFNQYEIENLLKQQDGLYPDYFKGNAFSQLFSNFKYKISNGYDYSKHVGTLTFNTTQSNIVFPSYNRHEGKYYHTCSACLKDVPTEFSFSSGTWTNYGTYAKRSYVINGNKYIDPTSYTNFSYSVDLNGGQIRNDNSSVVLNKTFSIGETTIVYCRETNFILNGKIAVNLEVYLDGKKIVGGSYGPIRVYTSLDETFVDIDYSKGVGNVYIKVIY